MATGIRTILTEIDNRCSKTFGVDFNLRTKFDTEEPTKGLEMALTMMSKFLDKQNLKFVLLVDEIDSLVGDTLLTVLRFVYFVTQWLHDLLGNCDQVTTVVQVVYFLQALF